ncbi:UDP-glucuronic acid decarboxylase family protein [Haliangium ochraceum]|uniref:UDP-glucuronate decarboxylase n=1 Tax=Haliangium ochraceum (strain DSM 14365 / JCM 11303 / SMP-2) TaxID=502025 RepID=D0LL53_HALO1|nr:UDP-glucuronic acid decarboxylase family protein [Haliangium ochraceum]ACY18549.1 NAD-dependent epimerase/dehydratase [Haliangium ochraceum DSM 14365]
MRTLVTGGAGFIGSHLCERLLDDGHEVVCADNFYTGSEDNIAHLRARPGFTLLRHDVVEPVPCEAERIYHLACPASPVHYQRDPVKTIQTSVLGAMHLLEQCRVTGARLLIASTSEVYGDPTVHPQSESYWGHVNPIGPRACYDEGKRVAETLCFDYQRRDGVDIRVVRIFNTYGPRMAMNDGRVVSNFVVQALRGEPLTIYGDGNQTRSFCYVDELVEGMVRMMNQDADTGPVNLGNPAEYTIRELAERVLTLTGSSSRVMHQALPADDPVRRKPDIARARTLLEWTPRISLEQGLERTIAYFRELLGYE